MKLGLYGINLGVCVDPEAAAAVARAAEGAGFDSVWTAEHVVLPDPQTPDSPIPAQTPLLDPAVALAHLAAHTRTIWLATGIIILPQRNPVVLAKELASLDVLSGGRLIFGAGAGYLASEFAAIGAAFDDRGERMDEYIEAILPDDQLEVSDMTQLVGNTGATKISMPVTVVGIAHGADRSVTVERSRDAISLGRLSALIPDDAGTIEGASYIILTRNV